MTASHYDPPADAPWPARGAAWLLRRYGWRLVLARPIPRKCVVIFYPHTSNWDFVIGLLARRAVDLHLRWAGKDSLFRGPLGALFRRWGGIPVNRRERTGFIERVVTQFADHDEFRLVIAPEGTRSRTAYWRSGFYHLARATGMPLAFAFIDYRTREIGVGDYFAPGGDSAADMARIAAFYSDKQGRHPWKQGPVRLREDISGGDGEPD